MERLLSAPFAECYQLLNAHSIVTTIKVNPLYHGAAMTQKHPESAS